MYTFGKWWKWKNAQMGFVYRVVWALKALQIFLCLKPSIFWENHMDAPENYTRGLCT